MYAFLFSLLLLGGVLSLENRGPPKCKKPPGKLGSSILDGQCGQSVCAKTGKKPAWKRCPRPANEENIKHLLETIEELVKNETKKVEEKIAAETKKIEEKIENICGTPPLPVVFQKSEEFAITRDNEVGVLRYIGRSYIITFQLFINTLDKGLRWANILHFTIGGDYRAYGDRTPGLWVGHATQFITGNPKFMLSSAINGNPKYDSPIFDFEVVTNKWYSIEISQLFQADDGEYMLSFKVDGVQFLNTMNNQPGNFKDVKMFLADPWYPALDASVKELTVMTTDD